jgi:hypothetical protein
MPALSRSRRPASGSRYSGSTRGPSTSSAAITGNASRKTDPHQKYSSIRPPSTGPTALPAEKLPIQTPMAMERSFGSVNMWKISDRVEGASVAPAIPRSARLRISISALVENAAMSDTTPKAAAPIMSSLRRPMRSPRVPIAMSEPATRNP